MAKGWVLVVACTAMVAAWAPATTEVNAAGASLVADCEEDAGALDVALEQSDPGATIEVRGTCQGNFFIDHDLTLVGARGSDGVGTLDGQRAGTVLRVDVATVTVRDLHITNGGDRGGGGGIYCLEASITLEGATEVYGNEVDGAGGGVQCSDGSELVVKDRASVHDNVADIGGGIYVGPGDVRLTMSGHASVHHNTARGSGGGGIFVRSGAAVELGGRSVVHHNRVAGSTASPAPARGGGIYIGAADLTMRDASSVHHNSVLAAGAPSVDGSSLGGGIMSHGGSVSLADSAFVGWNSSDMGGGVYSEQGSLIVADRAEIGENGSGSGGGVFNRDGAVVLQGRARVARNDALAGAGIFTTSVRSTLTMSDRSTVHANAASSVAGGVYTFGTPVEMRDRADISENTSGDVAGGLYLDAATIGLADRASIHHNHAGTSGGGIYNVSGREPAIVVDDRASIWANEAGLDGGGIWGGCLGTTLAGVILGKGGNVHRNVPDDNFVGPGDCG